MEIPCVVEPALHSGSAWIGVAGRALSDNPAALKTVADRVLFVRSELKDESVPTSCCSNQVKTDRAFLAGNVASPRAERRTPPSEFSKRSALFVWTSFQRPRPSRLMLPLAEIHTCRFCTEHRTGQLGRGRSLSRIFAALVPSPPSRRPLRSSASQTIRLLKMRREAPASPALFSSPASTDLIGGLRWSVGGTDLKVHALTRVEHRIFLDGILIGASCRRRPFQTHHFHLSKEAIGHHHLNPVCREHAPPSYRRVHPAP